MLGRMKKLAEEHEPTTAKDLFNLGASLVGTVAVLAIVAPLLHGWRVWVLPLAWGLMMYGVEEISHSVGVRRARGEISSGKEKGKGAVWE